MKFRKQEISSVYAVRDLIDKDPFRHRTIASYADSVGLSRNKLIYGFKELLGNSLEQYRIEVRMEKIKELLGNSDLTIKEIAGKTGYRSSSHFSYTFRQHVGIPPREWRNRSGKEIPA